MADQLIPFQVSKVVTTSGQVIVKASSRRKLYVVAGVITNNDVVGQMSFVTTSAAEILSEQRDIAADGGGFVFNFWPFWFVQVDPGKDLRVGIATTSNVTVDVSGLIAPPGYVPGGQGLINGSL